MTEPRRPNWDDTFIWTGTVWDTAFRAMLGELMNMLSWLLFHETDAGEGVGGGFAWSNPSGLTTRIGRGWAMVYDAAVLSPASKWKLVYLGSNAEDDHDAHEANPRIDVVSLSYTLTEDNSQVLGRGGGAVPAATYTQVGSVATLVITKGTAAASPSPPATPAGNLKLYEVWIPATSGAPVAYDHRDFAAGPKIRAGDRPMTAATEVGTDANLLEVSARAQEDGETSFLSSLRWDVLEDLPYFIRGKGGAGEEGNALYPLLSPAREWWRSSPWIGRTEDKGATPLASLFGGGYLRLIREDTGAIDHETYIPISVDVRGLEVVAAKLRYAVTGDVFDATFTDAKVYLAHFAADGTQTLFGSVALELTEFSTPDPAVAFTLSSTPVIVEGDTLYAFLNLKSTASGTAKGQINLYGLDVQFKEART